MSTKWPVRMWSIAQNAVTLGHTATVTPTLASGALDRMTLHLAPNIPHGVERITATWELHDRATPGDAQGGWHLVSAVLVGPHGGVQSIRISDVPPLVGTWRVSS